MKTIEMVLEAEKTEKVYKCDDDIIRYSNELGFYDISNNNKPLETYHFNTINDFFVIDNWREVKSKLMTLEQVEKELGYEITIINCLNCIYGGSDCNKCENYNRHSLRKE